MKKQGISIRYKILLLLTLLPVLTLAAYLVLALRIFEEDKIAYVFESSSRMSGALASQFKTQLNAALGTGKPIFQDYLLEQKFGAVAESVFANESSFESVIAFSPDTTGNYQKAGALEREPELVDKTLAALQSQLPQIFKEADQVGRLAKIPFNDDRIFIFEKVQDEKTQRSTVFLMVVRITEIAEMFRASLSQKMYLISNTGKVLFGPEELRGKPLQSSVTPSFLKDGSSNIMQGAETVKSSKGSELLVSFSKVGFGDLIVVTSVEKSKALSAVEILIRKSLIFFVILISLTVIVSLVASSGLTESLTQLFNATKKVAEGDFNFRVTVKSNDEVGTLADNFNTMAAEVARLLEQTAEKARMESELQTAKTVQDTLFPEKRAQIGQLSVAGFYEPASECGGDWWHYCDIGGKTFLWIGDATGHGAPAALITSAAKSAASIIERLDVSPAVAVELLNKCIYDVSKGRIMMTFFLASFDSRSGEFTYCNASHEAPFLIKKAEGVLQKRDLVSLNEINNPRLGQDRESIYKETTIRLEPGDAVFLYTDGIPDIQNPTMEAWGERKFLKSLVEANKDFPNIDLSLERFVKSFQAHRQGAPLVDDVTFFMVKNEGSI